MKTFKEIAVLLAFLIMLFISVQVNCSEIVGRPQDCLEGRSELDRPLLK